MPFLSIIIPTYNRPNKLSNVLEYINLQTFKDFEVLIVEDGVNNSILYNELFPDLKIIYTFSATKLNVSEKRNIGARKSNSDYIIFLDDDDYITKDWVSDFYFSLNNSNIDVAFCAVTVLKNGIKLKTIMPGNAYNDERRWGVFLAGAFCVKKQIFNSVGCYDEVLKYGENTELGFRIKQEITSKVFIENSNLIYNSSLNGGSKNIQNTFTANSYILKKHKMLFKKSPVLHYNYLSVLGVASAKLNKFSEAKIYFIHSLKIRPLKPISWARLVLVFIPFLSKKVWK